VDFGPFGLGEVVFIGLLALVLFGPKRLPELARSVGGVMTALRRGTEELKRNFQEELDAAGDPTGELRDAAGQLRAAGDDLKSIGRSVAEEGKRIVTGGEPVARDAVLPTNSEAEPEPEPARDGDER
jgi:TatA/E family protein of Tat protein translocase